MTYSPFLESVSQKVRGLTVALPDCDDDRLELVARKLKSDFNVSSYIPSKNDLLVKKSLVEFHIQKIRSERLKPQTSIPESTLLDPFYNCGAVLAEGKVDAFVGGLSVPTTHVIRAALATVGLAEGTQLLSSVFMMLLANPTESLVEKMIFTDGAVNPTPTPEDLVSIGALAAEAFQKWTGELARLGFLSFSTLGSAEHAVVSQTREAVSLFKTKFPEIICDGEMQFDTAVSPQVAARKAPGSSTAGKVNVAVFPDLNAANIGYKIAERLGGAQALGPVLLGTRFPLSDLSRGASVESVVSSVILTLALKSAASM